METKQQRVATLLKLKVSEEEIYNLFSRIERKNFNPRSQHWRVENGSATIQSLCWLYDWALTGEGSEKARIPALFAFDSIFLNIKFDDFDGISGWVKWTYDEKYTHHKDLTDDFLRFWDSRNNTTMMQQTLPTA
jgi:hypothetical protein